MIRPRPKVEGASYPVAAQKNRNMPGGVPKGLRSGAKKAMHEMAARQAAERKAKEYAADSEGEY